MLMHFNLRSHNFLDMLLDMLEKNFLANFTSIFDSSSLHSQLSIPMIILVDFI